MDISQLPQFIDVSRWQGYINWAQVKNNISGAMIKIAGSDDGFYMDGQAHRNVIEARANNIPFGVYVFLGGVHGISEEVQHIVNVVNQLGGLRPGEPLALDWEMRRSGLDEVAYLTGIAKGLGAKGFAAPLVYMNLNYVRTNNWKSLVDYGCGLWVAAWGDNDSIAEPNEVPPSDEWPFWAMWQYSSNTSVPGIVGRVDHNVFNGTIDQFKKYGSPAAVSFPGSPVVTSTPSNVYTGQAEYTVVPGDNLSAIAARWGRSWQELYAMNRDRIADPNRIFANQRLRVWADSQKPTTTHPDPQPAATERYHVVASGENLSVIAARYHLSSWQTLYDMNRSVIGSDPNLIKPGQRLRIP